MAFADDVLALSPVCYLRLGETSGTNAVDEVGEVTATYTLSYTLGVDSLIPSDSSNKALRLAAGGYVDIAQEAALDIVQDITMMCIIKTSTGTSSTAIFAKYESGTTGSYAIHIASSGGRIRWVIRVGGSVYDLSTVGNFIDGDEHLIIGRRSGADMKLVITDPDGSVVETLTRSDAGTGDLFLTTTGVHIGAWTNVAGAYSGDVDECALFNTALSDSEITDLINSWAGITPPAPVEGGAADVYALSTFEIQQAKASDVYALNAATVAYVGNPADIYALNALEIVSGAYSDVYALADVQLVQGNAADIYALLAEPITSPTASLVTYTCVIEGAADSLPDLILPISSFQGAIRSGRPSFLSVVVPDALRYTDDIIARPNGDLVVTRNVIFTDQSSESAEIARVNPPSIRTDRGARSSSITLSGEKQTTNTSPKAVTIDQVNYRAFQTDGKRRFRANLNNNLRAGDEAFISVTGETIVVDQVQYTVGPSQAAMEIVEA
ncbi:MAG: LamG domain-containing protein [Woeseia sp.]|nr:LamG domain-containing protein [Woeseia sp.]